MKLELLPANFADQAGDTRLIMCVRDFLNFVADDFDMRPLCAGSIACSLQSSQEISKKQRKPISCTIKELIKLFSELNGYIGQLVSISTMRSREWW